MNDDELEIIELEPRPHASRRARRRFTSSAVVVLAAVLLVAGGAVAIVSSDHHKTHKSVAAPSAPTTEPAFSASMLGFTSGRFAVVASGRLEFVDAHSRTITPAAAPAGPVAIAATNGASLIVVALRHWFLVEPDRPPVPVPDGNVFARHAGGWWLVQGGAVRVLGGLGPALHTPAGTTAVGDSSEGFVVQDDATDRVLIWNPGRPAARLRPLVSARAEILAAAGDKVAWRAADGDSSPVHIVDVVTGHATTLAHTDLTTAADASLAPDGKHVAFYNRRKAGTVGVFDTASDALLVTFNARSLGVFSSVTSLPGPTSLQPLPFTWTPDGVKIVVLGTPYPIPRITALDTIDGIAITTPASLALDQVAALDASAS